MQIYQFNPFTRNFDIIADSAGGDITGAITSGQVAIGSGANQIGGSSNFTFINDILKLTGTFEGTGIAAPAVSPVNTGRIYYDLALNKWRASQNGGAYTDLISTSGIGGSITVGQVAFGAVTANSIAGESNFLWDTASKKLTLSTTTNFPTITDSLLITALGDGGARITFRTSTGPTFRIGMNGSGGADFPGLTDGNSYFSANGGTFRHSFFGAGDWYGSIGSGGGQPKLLLGTAIFDPADTGTVLEIHSHASTPADIAIFGKSTATRLVSMTVRNSSGKARLGVSDASSAYLGVIGTGGGNVELTYDSGKLLRIGANDSTGIFVSDNGLGIRQTAAPAAIADYGITYVKSSDGNLYFKRSIAFGSTEYQLTPPSTASPGGVTGSVQFNNGTFFAGEAATFHWDSSSKNLTVGVSVGSYSIKATVNSSSAIISNAIEGRNESAAVSLGARGLFGSATGIGAVVNYGIYGTASSGTTNWAGYFDDGDVFIKNDLYWQSGAGFNGILAHANTADRTYTFQNASGTVAFLSDITAGVTGAGTTNAATYWSSSSAIDDVALNATATNMFLRQVSSGVPSFASLVAGDIPALGDSELVVFTADPVSTPSVVHSTKFRGFEFTDGSDKGVVGTIRIPYKVDLTAVNPVLNVTFITTVAAVAGNSRLRLTARYLADGELTSAAASQTITQDESTTNTNNAINQAAFTLDRTLMAAADEVNFFLERVGTDVVNDTFTGTIAMLDSAQFRFNKKE
jgi:hypothetical protein